LLRALLISCHGSSVSIARLRVRYSSTPVCGKLSSCRTTDFTPQAISCKLVNSSRGTCVEVIGEWLYCSKALTCALVNYAALRLLPLRHLPRYLALSPSPRTQQVTAPYPAAPTIPSHQRTTGPEVYTMDSGCSCV
jgi:hypothetical protein